MGEGVVIFTNLSSKAVEAVMPELGEDKDVLGYSLSEGDIVDDLDTMRQHGMYVGLKPWETQVFFYSSGKEPIS